jgi:hypothetical protein
MGWLRNLERWLRKNLWNPAKRTVAGELKQRLGDIDAAVQGAVLAYAASVGGEPLATFLAVAMQGLGLSDAASKWVQGLIDRLGAGSNRGLQTTMAAERKAVARNNAATLMAAIREEASKG